MEGFCRGCLIKYDEPLELLQYTEKNRRLFVYSTGLQVKRNDTFTFQLCKDCFLNMKSACKFKKLCRTSDKRFKSYLALKDVGDPVDFCTFLKNSDDTMTFRLPMHSGNSTPANHKRDDDIESTCTSIRNFMTDILQGEVVPDTEARIIREVIEEETDVLDDSLDSQWLQDDMSIDTDFRLDLSFSPFSTPRAVNNDRCYTPKSLRDQKEDQVNYYTINSEKQTKILNDFTNAFKNEQNVKTLCDIGVDEIELCAEKVNTALHNAKQDLPDFDIDEIDGTGKSENKHDQSLIELGDLGLNDLDKSESSPFENDLNVNEFSNFDIPDMDKSKSNMSLPSLDSLDKDKINVQNFYIPKDDIVPMESNKEITNGSMDIEAFLKEKPCTIDTNLEEALKNTTDKDFALDDLLVSPAVYQGASAASTPTITNILFGEKLDIVEKNINPIKKIGQCIEKFDNVKVDIEIIEEFFQDDTKEFDLDDIKKENNIEEEESIINAIDIFLSENEQIEETKNNTKYIITTPDDKRFDFEKLNCNLCEKKFKNNRALSIHLTKTHKIKIIRPFKVKYVKKKENRKLCIHCGKDFGENRTLKRHLEKCLKIKGNIKQVFKCDRCPIECETQNKLNRHTLSHKGIFRTKKADGKKIKGNIKQVFKCDRCPIECETQNKLNRHTLSHKGIFRTKKVDGKHCVCTICGVTVKVGNYSLHLMRHNKTYTEKCQECGKGFYRASDLKCHMRKHTGETPFSCEYCTRLFSRKDVYIRHIRTHTNEKLYFCDNCDLRFMQKSDVRRHIVREYCMKKKAFGDQKLEEESHKKEVVTVIYATGDDKSIRKQLPFLETEMST